MTKLKVSSLTTDSLVELNQSEMKQVVGGNVELPDISITTNTQISLQGGLNLGVILGDNSAIVQSITSSSTQGIFINS